MKRNYEVIVLRMNGEASSARPEGHPPEESLSFGDAQRLAMMLSDSMEVREVAVVERLVVRTLKGAGRIAEEAKEAAGEGEGREEGDGDIKGPDFTSRG